MKDVDILSIHMQILQKLRYRFEQLPVLLKKITDLEYIQSSENLNSIVKENICTELKQIKNEYNQIENYREINFYLLKVTPLIDDYKKELEKPVRMNFMGESLPTDDTIKKKIVQEYIQIGKKYIDVVEVADFDITFCSNCEKQSMVPTYSNIYICSQCGLNQEITQIMFSYKDNDRINITTKYTYDRRIHFRDCINQFQGKQHSTISPKVYEKLYEQLRLHALELQGETREEKYKNVTKRHITTFLKETGNSKHYEDLNLIYHTITGAKLDDISHLEEVLIQDFDILNELYDQMYIKTKKIERKNFINTQYVLYQLLRRHKYPCKESDFNFLKTTERKCFHDTICSDLFSQLSWSFSHVF